MNKNKDGRSVAPADQKKATNKDDDWKKKCDDCEFFRMYNDCSFGCDIVKKSLIKKKNHKN